MRTMFIPEIGTRILLARPFQFQLFAERRNKAIVDALGYPGYILRRSFWLDAAQQRSMEDILEEPIHHPDLVVTPWRNVADNPNSPLRKECALEMRLPEGTVLGVDRIYIRKGVSDFSSVSFNIVYCPNPILSPKTGFAKMGGTKATIDLVKGNAKNPRFWVKLHDVNRMEYDETFRGDFLPHDAE